MIEIINGEHSTPAIGQLENPDGNIIKVWADNIPEAMIQAIGKIPSPPEMGLGGDLIATSHDAHGFANAYMYNPSEDVKNTVRGQMYIQTILAWNLRAAKIQQAIEMIIKNLPKE